MSALSLSEIVISNGTQIRARIDSDTVDEYALAMRAGAKFPPVEVFHDGSEYILADGFHRVMAASRNGFIEIPATIHKGTKSDALKFALSANAVHGLKRTNADKRRSVDMALREWPKLSDRSIAEMCAVNHKLVSSARAEQVGDSPTSPEPTPTRTGRDGKSYPATNKKSESPSARNEETEDEEKECPTHIPEPEIDLEDESAMENDFRQMIEEASPALLDRLLVYVSAEIKRRG